MDAIGRGYEGGLSIEPHMVVVFHDAQSKAASENALSQNFIEYGRRLGEMVSELEDESGRRLGPEPERRDR